MMSLSSSHLLYDEVESLVQSLALRLGIALVILVVLVVALIIVIRKKPEKRVS